LEGSKILKRYITELLSTGIYTGYFPTAPGTIGSLWAIPTGYFLATLRPFNAFALIVLIVALSVWLSGEAEYLFNRPDPPEVVIDEIAGLSLAICLVPVSFTNIIILFLLFRVFDIIKPFPVNWIERTLAKGWGIVFDDLMASLYAVFCWYLVRVFI